MDKHKIFIKWDSYNAEETKDIFELGANRMSKELSKGIVFDVEYEESQLESFRLDSGVLVAIITSASALVVSIVSLIAQIIASKIANSKAVLEIQLKDGTKIIIPASASKGDIEKKLNIVKSLQSVEEIAIETP